MNVDECVARAEWSLRNAEGDNVRYELVQSMAQQAAAWALLALIEMLRERKEDR